MALSLNLLISSAGRRNQLIDCFRRDAQRLGIGLRVIAADVAPGMSPACHQADAAIAVPRCSDAAFVPALLELCRREKVDLVVPTIDPELGVLARCRDQFREAGARVLVASSEVTAIAADKLATAQTL